MRKAIELLIEDVDLKDNLDNIFGVLEKEYGLVPTMSHNEEYRGKGRGIFK